jgi:hypothetical protein
MEDIMEIGGEDKLVSVREAAKMCDRNPETIRRWIWSGKLPAEKLGNQLFVKQSILTNFLREEMTTLQTQEQDLPEQTKESAGEQSAEMKHNQTVKLPGSRMEVIGQLQNLREEIRKRTGNIEVSETIRQLRGNV